MRKYCTYVCACVEWSGKGKTCCCFILCHVNCMRSLLLTLFTMWRYMQWAPMTIHIHVMLPLLMCHTTHVNIQTKTKMERQDRHSHTHKHNYMLIEQMRDWYVSMLDVCSSTWLHGTWHELNIKKTNDNNNSNNETLATFKHNNKYCFKFFFVHSDF